MPKLNLTFFLVLVNIFIIYFFNNEFHKYDSISLEKNTRTQQQHEVQVDKTNEETYLNANQKKTHAVIHMGVHKTGSSSIQITSKKYQEKLKDDGYEMPWVNFRKQHPNVRLRLDNNQVHLSSCFIPSKERKFECIPGLLEAGLDIARRKKNIFITSETFSKMQDKGIEDLLLYLSHWDEVTIIIYYRRYYDYLHSVYNQKHRGGSLGGGFDKWETSLLHFILDQIQSGPTVAYTASLVSRLKKHLNSNNSTTKFNIVIMNYHNTTNLLESFYCEAVPNAYHTCDAIKSSSDSFHSNPSPFLGYGYLTYSARKSHLIDFNSINEMNRLTALVQNHHETVLGRTKNDFKVMCLPKDKQEVLLDKSLEYEKEVLPGLNGYDLRTDFDKQVMSNLCVVDVESTLQQPEWQKFFSSL